LKKKYKYRLRPCFGKTEVLIEFIGIDNYFISYFVDALVEINPKITDIEDLWMNDEILLHIQTDGGNFLFSKDIYDSVFIMSKENQSLIYQIDELLGTNNVFQKIDLSD
jgi:hypothetical protein